MSVTKSNPCEARDCCSAFFLISSWVLICSAQYVVSNRGSSSSDSSALMSLSERSSDGSS